MKIFVLDGIGTSNTTSKVIDDTASVLSQKLNTTAEWIKWPASMAGVGGNTGWERSSNVAYENLRDKVKASDEKVIILAYSGGNRPAHQFLDRHPELHSKIAAVGLMSDPWRPADRWQVGTPDPRGFGVCGQDYGPIADRTFWTCVPGDPIASAAPDSLLRYAADACDGEPDQLIADFLYAASKGRFQLAPMLGLPFIQWFTGLGPRIAASIDEANRYLTGWHTTRYVQPYRDGDSMAVRLGNTIAWKVTNDSTQKGDA